MCSMYLRDILICHFPLVPVLCYLIHQFQKRIAKNQKTAANILLVANKFRLLQTPPDVSSLSAESQATVPSLVKTET